MNCEEPSESSYDSESSSEFRDSLIYFDSLIPYQDQCGSVDTDGSSESVKNSWVGFPRYLRPTLKDSSLKAVQVQESSDFNEFHEVSESDRQIDAQSGPTSGSAFLRTIQPQKQKTTNDSQSESSLSSSLSSSSSSKEPSIWDDEEPIPSRVHSKAESNKSSVESSVHWKGKKKAYDSDEDRYLWSDSEASVVSCFSGESSLCDKDLKPIRLEELKEEFKRKFALESKQRMDTRLNPSEELTASRQRLVRSEVALFD